ncbi:DUF6362 family protein [Ochrobactrum sp. MYb379]|uniref:DUF6362 family protein n=1 Tax=Ochrobactrum sp. MYb379 TaxID=2745275 RepID=UPI0030A3E093
MTHTYQAWSHKDIEARIVEAAATLMLMPNEKMPEPVQAIWREYKDEYGKGRTRYRKRPEGAAIDRMYETWGWINALESKSDRKLLYGWARVKAHKGMRLGSFALENMMNDRQLKRKIDELNQQIANNQNRLCLVRLTDAVASVSENEHNSHQQTVSSESCEHRTTHWIAPDAKPRNIPSLQEKMKPAA